MNSRFKSHPSPHYRIRLKERLDNRWSHWFEKMAVTASGEETVLTGPIADQAALHGLLVQIRDLNLTLLSLERLCPGHENAQKSNRL